MANMVYVDSGRCTGCGLCLPACEVDAISLASGRAYIDQTKCVACEACVEACPLGAILTVTEPADERQPILAGASGHGFVPQVRLTALSAKRKLWPWLGPAFVFVGRQVLPRLAVALLDAWDQHLANSPKPGSIKMPSGEPPVQSGAGRPYQHRLRQRGR